MMEIRRITRENAGDLRLKNEPFPMPGRFIPSLRDGVWDYRVELFGRVETMTFPDESYDYQALNQNGAAFGAYVEGRCVGLAVCRDAFWGYMYLHDLKVLAAYRGQGIGRALIEAARREALSRGYRGLHLQAQDNNLNACLFYLRTGFEIGGFDNHVYNGTSQEGKADVLFYSKPDCIL